MYMYLVGMHMHMRPRRAEKEEVYTASCPYLFYDDGNLVQNARMLYYYVVAFASPRLISHTYMLSDDPKMCNAN